jgi:GT2 family glycosyltransferase
LESIRKETKAEYELTVVADTPDKVTLQVLDDLDVERIVNSERVGWTKAVNQGIKHKKAELYVVTADDTIVTTNWLTKLANSFDDSVGLVSPITNTGGQWLQELIRCETSDYAEMQRVGQWVSKYHKELLVDWMPIFGFCFALPQTTIDRVGYFDDNMFLAHSEIDYCHRVIHAKLRVMLRMDTYVHHFGKVTASRDKDLKKYWNRDTEYYNKKWGSDMNKK